MSLYQVQATIARPHVSGPERPMTCRAVAPQRARVIATRGAAAPAPPPVNITPPVVSGLMQIGQLLTSTTGVWTDAVSYAPQWLRDGVPIGGATSLTYTAVGADVRALVTCQLVATGPGGVSSPVSSNALSSYWQPMFVAKPGVLIWDGQDPQCYGGAAVGAPVAALYTVDGVLLASQPLTARQATRSSGGQLDCDGGDDVYAGTPALASYWQVDCTYCVGAEGLSGSSGETALEVKGAGATPYHLAVIAGSTNPARNYHRTSDAGASMLGLPGASQDLAVVWTSGTPGAGELYDTSAGVTSVRTVAPATLPIKTYTQWSLGGNTAQTVTWQGDLRYFALDSTAWSSGDLATWRSCALAAGVM